MAGPEPLSPASEQSKAAGTHIPDRILAGMHLWREYVRAEITAASAVSDLEWSWAFKQLKEEGKVQQVGERRGARYRKL